MEELWPELEAVPMGEGLAGSGADRAHRRRKLDIFLDRVHEESTPVVRKPIDAVRKAQEYINLELVG
jgi:hypothetical protein